jgi:phage head maturation protease
MSFNHDPNYILARSKEGKGTLKLEVDATGLKYSYDSPKRIMQMIYSMQ